MIKVENLYKSFKNGNSNVEILKNVNLNIPKSKLVTILGPSGSGKTTLLNIIAGLESFSVGNVYWDEYSLKDISQKKKESIRIKKIGYIFQEYFLLNNLTVLENVQLSGKLVGKTKKDAKQALEKVGLGEHKYKLPDQLSGGQKQRVAIARAIVKNPEILICDEPTGALDTESSKNVLEVLKKIQKEEKTTIIMVTHNEKIARISDKVIYVKDGNIVSEEEGEACNVGEVEW
ncbi:ABC transporter ATP-binding protein [Clostridium sp.]|uniref:ABC transporter ATP-binding protein n=1 Tax=Clostridium sp. TaxID=1506 RepID=UPI003D6D89EE